MNLLRLMFGLMVVLVFTLGASADSKKKPPRDPASASSWEELNGTSSMSFSPNGFFKTEGAQLSIEGQIPKAFAKMLKKAGAASEGKADAQAAIGKFALTCEFPARCLLTLVDAKAATHAEANEVFSK